MQENQTETTASTEGSGAKTGAETIAETSENQTESGAESNSAEISNGNNEATAVDDNSAESDEANATPEMPVEPEEEEEITYHAVQKEESVTAIWEMQGRKHIRTIDPRSREGAEILRLFTAEEGEEAAAA